MQKTENEDMLVHASDNEGTHTFWLLRRHARELVFMHHGCEDRLNFWPLVNGGVDSEASRCGCCHTAADQIKKARTKTTIASQRIL